MDQSIICIPAPGEVWVLLLCDELGTDLRCTVRMMRRNPGLVAVAVLSLALGIGANTAIFSVLNAVVLRPLPYPHPEQLVALSERTSNLPLMYIALPNLDDWRAMNTVFDSIEGFRANDVTLTGDGTAQRLSVRQVSAGFFTMLGVAPILGRPILTQDDRPEAKPVVLLSDSLWIRQFIFRKIKNSGRQIGCRGGSGILALWLGVWLASAETVRPLPRMNLRIAGREQLSLSGRTQRRGRRLCLAQWLVG